MDNAIPFYASLQIRLNVIFLSKFFKTVRLNVKIEEKYVYIYRDLDIQLFHL